jgi:hypothetical protein
MKRSQTGHLCLVLLAFAASLSGCGANATSNIASSKPSPVPLLAYYYIWFTPQSWSRAKTDLPELGLYSSDDRNIVRQHVRWAKAAGIDGFIVSWKSTDTLNRRLRLLIDVATEEQFKLQIIYQGLDFERNPLPATRIANDLDLFLREFADNPVFNIFGHPLIIWSGTWKFSASEVAQVTGGRRDRLLILASERKPKEYERLATLVDGNAYYWSSANPGTFPDYQGRLDAMAQIVRQHHGLWIAPVAPGFDARLIGGTRVVERDDGIMLRSQFAAALASSPDALGLISWNEFSENSHVEPSQAFGHRYLDVLAELRAVPNIPDFDSSEPADTQPEALPLIALAGLVFLVFGSLAMIFWRARR